MHRTILHGSHSQRHGSHSQRRIVAETESTFCSSQRKKGYQFARTHPNPGVWVKQYPIVLLEMAWAKNDCEGWKALAAALGSRIELVGDDIFCTNPHILQQGIEKAITNSILIKRNRSAPLLSETEDTFISQMTVAAGAGPLDRCGMPERARRQIQPTSTDRGTSVRKLASAATKSSAIPGLLKRMRELPHTSPPANWGLRAYVCRRLNHATLRNPYDNSSSSTFLYCICRWMCYVVRNQSDRIL